jgi:hypothetical protein
LAAFCWLITRIRFFRNTGLTNQLLIALFIVRILFMVVGCYVNLYVLPVSDSVAFHDLGTEQFNLLFTDPHEYFVNIFHNRYIHGYSRVFDDYHSFWNNLRTNLIAKMISIFDLLSFKNFWINSLFFNFLIFFGSVALYKVFINQFPKAAIQLIFCIFLLPSAIFFSSMIHRDGLIFLAVSMIVYHFYFMAKPGRISGRRLAILILFLLIIFLLRNFVFLALIPALLAWLIALKFPQKVFLTFTIVYALFILFFFVSGFISSKIDFPSYVSERQESFIEIGKNGNSTLKVKPLEPTLKSFIYNTPQAFNLSLMRPYLSKITKPAFAPFAIELLLIQILFILFLFFHKRNAPVHPVVYFNVFFSVSMLIMAGYTVPIVGAMVRYRSIYFIFLMIPITCYMDWQRLRLFFRPGKK